MARRSKKPLTPQELLELELQQERELVRLQRQYKIMERDRTGGGGDKLAKQRKVIKILRSEQKNVMTDLNIAMSPSKKKQDLAVSTKLNTLLQDYDTFDSSIDVNQTFLTEMDFQIRKVEKQVYELRRRAVTDEQFQMRVLAGEKAVGGLENKLDTTVKQFCIISTQNRKLRDEVDHLLKERAKFNILWERLISNLSKGKKFMMDMIEQATVAYDQRDEWCNKLNVLRTRGQADLKMHTQEMRMMQRKLDNDGKLEEFLGIKSQRRVMRDLEDRKMRKRQKTRRIMEQKLTQYQEILADIQKFTGEESVNRVAQMYIKREQENFSIFLNINDLNLDMDQICQNLETVHLQIDEQRNLDEQREEQQRTNLENLRAELALATKDADEAERNLENVEDELNKLIAGIDSMFTITSCDKDPLLELLGDNTNITKFNVPLYLKLLEQKINDLIMCVYYKEKLAARDKKKVSSTLIKDEKVRHKFRYIEEVCPSNPCPLCEDQENVSDVIDTLQFVLDREQVKQKLHKRLLLPDGLAILHNVSACQLPKSREIMQRRYQ